MMLITSVENGSIYGRLNQLRCQTLEDGYLVDGRLDDLHLDAAEVLRGLQEAWLRQPDLLEFRSRLAAIDLPEVLPEVLASLLRDLEEWAKRDDSWLQGRRRSTGRRRQYGW